MKKLILFLHALAIASFYSCDEVEGPTRENIAVDTTCEFDVDNTPPVKKVLVEDYTGHNCGNCPAGGVVLNDSMRNKYGDDMVVITIHAGDYANVCPGLATCPPNAPAGSFAMDYKTSTGNEWHDFFDLFFYPAGMIDRSGYPSTNLRAVHNWDQDVQNRLNVPANVRLRIQNNYTEATRNVRTCVETKFFDDMTGDYKLSVVLTEDSIIDWQVWYGHNPELVEDYVHHHLLRTSLNTAFGVNAASGTITNGMTVVNGYNLTLDPSWNENHCAIVAFVYNADTYEVLQVEELKVK